MNQTAKGRGRCASGRFGLKHVQRAFKRRPSLFDSQTGAAGPIHGCSAGAILLASTFVLAACSPMTRKDLSPQAMMTHVAKQAQSCWFGKKDPALKGTRLAPEINSFSGKPRILIVPGNNPAGLPKLVAQAERQNGQTKFTTFGPMLASADGTRLNASLHAWSRGSKNC